MNSTLSDTMTTTTPPISAKANDNMGYSSLTIGIIVLCVVSGLVVVSLSIFLFIKKRRTATTFADNEKQHDETSNWWLWSLSPSLAATPNVVDSSSIHHDNNTHKTMFASLPTSVLLSRTSKKVSTATEARTMLDDIPLPPSTMMTTATTATTPLPAPPRPAVTTTTILSRWKQDHHQVKNRPPIVFEEGYDSKALLRTPYYHHHDRPHPPSHHHHHQSNQEHGHPSPYTMTNPPPPPHPLNDSSFSSVDDPCLLESLERQKHINDIYYRTPAATSASTSTTTFYRHHRPSPSWGSSTIIQPPCINNNNNSSLLSLSMTEKIEQDAELQRLSISSYHVW